MTPHGRDWVNEFLGETPRGQQLGAELEELERALIAAAGPAARPQYLAVADCWLVILRSACEYASISTACDYVSVLKRFQHRIQDVIQQLGADLDAISPGPCPETHSARPAQRAEPEAGPTRPYLHLVEGTPADAVEEPGLRPDTD